MPVIARKGSRQQRKWVCCSSPINETKRKKKTQQDHYKMVALPWCFPLACLPGIYETEDKRLPGPAVTALPSFYFIFWSDTLWCAASIKRWLHRSVWYTMHMISTAKMAWRTIATIFCDGPPCFLSCHVLGALCHVPSTCHTNRPISLIVMRMRRLSGNLGAVLVRKP